MISRPLAAALFVILAGVTTPIACQLAFPITESAPVVDSGTAVVDSGTSHAPGAGLVSCGVADANCKAGKAEGCCRQGPAMDGSFTCEGVPECADAGAMFKCDDPTDCPGQICCIGSITPKGAAQAGSACTDTCEIPMSPACDPSKKGADCVTGSCIPFTVSGFADAMPGFYYCSQ